MSNTLDSLDHKLPDDINAVWIEQQELLSRQHKNSSDRYLRTAIDEDAIAIKHAALAEK
jgi:hypothetical protein